MIQSNKSEKGKDLLLFAKMVQVVMYAKISIAFACNRLYSLMNLAKNGFLQSNPRSIQYAA